MALRKNLTFILLAAILICGCSEEPNKPLTVTPVLDSRSNWSIVWSEEWSAWAKKNSIDQEGIELTVTGCEKVIPMKSDEQIIMVINRQSSNLEISFGNSDGKVMTCMIDNATIYSNQIVIFPKYSYNSLIAKFTFDSGDREISVIPLQIKGDGG